MGSTNKKIVIHRFDRDSISGFANPQSYLQPDGVEVLTVSGSVLRVPYNEIKVLYFVRDFDTGDSPVDCRVFQTRPKIGGLWLRMKLRSGELMDGVIPNNLLLVEEYGVSFVPPPPGLGKAFIPREAMLEMQVVGVVGSPLRVAKPKPKVPEEQISLFD